MQSVWRGFENSSKLTPKLSSFQIVENQTLICCVYRHWSVDIWMYSLSQNKYWQIYIGLPTSYHLAPMQNLCKIQPVVVCRYITFQRMGDGRLGIVISPNCSPFFGDRNTMDSLLLKVVCSTWYCYCCLGFIGFSYIP